MEKRVDRNQNLYEKVNKEIENKVKAHSNSNFDETKKTLSSIDPEFFGENSLNKKEKEHNKRKVPTALIVFIIVVILIIILAVVIYCGRK